jgi:hypothetical protein
LPRHAPHRLRAGYSAIPHRDANINDRVTGGTIASPPGFPGSPLAPSKRVDLSGASVFDRRASEQLRRNQEEK